ncbi:MAG: signal recognition particle protein [Limnochordaceae bacterium]|nr:signal recognition particle protein [Limnochordaceae bacterium]
MFGTLSQRLQQTFQRLRSRGRLTEQDVDAALREVRLALLEADVHFRVVKEFIQRLRERAVGEEVLHSLTPTQMVIKLVHQELTQLMGGEAVRLQLTGQPTVVLLVGLQGAGKTTAAAKLAGWLQRDHHRPLLVAADVYRPAAIRQLQVLGEQLHVPVFEQGTDVPPVTIATQGVTHARLHGYDVVLIDTAGRLQIDEAMMAEVREIKSQVQPQEILLVVDAMTGQEAVNVASQFNEALQLTGVILTKLDGDARGGAALSIRKVTGAPIKFVGVGEKLDALEPFYPDRMAARILGMGDVLSLIERAQSTLDQKEAREVGERLARNSFTLEDFLVQMQQVRRLGPLDQLLGMIPGFDRLAGHHPELGQQGEQQMRRVEAIIRSMTPQERRQPGLIDASRKRRIAAGSGTTVQDVNRLLKEFDQVRSLMKQVSGQAKRKGAVPKGLRFPF